MIVAALLLSIWLGEITSDQVFIPCLSRDRPMLGPAITIYKPSMELADLYADITGQTRKANPFIGSAYCGRSWRVFVEDGLYVVRVTHPRLDKPITAAAYPMLGGLTLKEF